MAFSAQDLLKANLYTIIIPIALAAFFWMSVGVLDNDIKVASKEKDPVKFIKIMNIIMGGIVTTYGAYHILKMTPLKTMLPKF
jgi:uncharacterized protein with PQ loop repeat